MADVEVDSFPSYSAVPKDIAAEAGNIKLFNKWDYEVEVRDISLT
jgi:small subunit ribosomal protein S5e